MLVATVLSLALAGAPKSPTPSFSALVSPTESARYALMHGCIAAARRGGKLADVPNAFIRPVGGKPGLYRMNGAGQVYLSDAPQQGGCYVRVGQGQPKDLRRMALDLLAAEKPTRPMFDSGEGGRDSQGPFRQESHCVVVGGREMAVLISTSDGGPGKAAMQLTLVAAKSPCGGTR